MKKCEWPCPEEASHLRETPYGDVYVCDAHRHCCLHCGGDGCEECVADFGCHEDFCPEATA